VKCSIEIDEIITIFNSFQSLKFTTTEGNQPKAEDEKNVDECNYEAGLELRAYYEKQWQELRKKLETNAAAAKVCA